MKNNKIHTLVALIITFCFETTTSAHGENFQGAISVVVSTAGFLAAGSAIGPNADVAAGVAAGYFSAVSAIALLVEYIFIEDKDKSSVITFTREMRGLTLHTVQASSGYEKGKEEGKVSLDSESLRQAVQMTREDAKNLLTTGESSALLEETIHSLRAAAESRGMKEAFDRFSDRELAEALTIVELI